MVLILGRSFTSLTYYLLMNLGSVLPFALLVFELSVVHQPANSGSALGETSTKSSPSDWALVRASATVITPTCPPSPSINLILWAVIWSLTRIESSCLLGAFDLRMPMVASSKIKWFGRHGRDWTDDPYRVEVVLYHWATRLNSKILFPHPAFEFGIDRLSHRVASAVP